jgi:AcrR family transcriptional regulator
LRSQEVQRVPKITEEHERNRRKQILAAAMACFARNGYRSTSVEDIVQESGLSVGAIYTYYPSKQDLFLALAEERTTETLEQFRTIYERPGSMADKNRDAVELFFQQMSAELAPYCRVSFEFWSEAPNSEALQAERARLCDSIREFLGWALTEARDAGELRSDVDIASAAELILALDDGLMMHHVSGVQPLALDILKRTYIALLDSGLASPTGSLVAEPEPERIVSAAGSRRGD